MRITFEKYFWNFIFISDLFRQKGGDGREEKRVCDCGFCWSCSDGGHGDWSRGDEKTVRQISTASGTSSSSSSSSWSSSSSVHTLLPTQTQPAQTRICLSTSAHLPSKNICNTRHRLSNHTYFYFKIFFLDIFLFLCWQLVSVQTAKIGNTEVGGRVVHTGP